MNDRDDPGCDSPSMGPIGEQSTRTELPVRERIRRRYGLSRRQWEFLVAAAIVLPYPLAIAIYLQFPVSETAFLTATVAYSIVAVYGSYKL